MEHTLVCMWSVIPFQSLRSPFTTYECPPLSCPPWTQHVKLRSLWSYSNPRHSRGEVWRAFVVNSNCSLLLVWHHIWTIGLVYTPNFLTVNTVNSSGEREKLTDEIRDFNALTDSTGADLADFHLPTGQLNTVSIASEMRHTDLIQYVKHGAKI